MKEINIKSNQQSGGITAGIIENSKGEKMPKNKLNDWLNRWGAIASIVAVIIAILVFFGLDYWSK